MTRREHDLRVTLRDHVDQRFADAEKAVLSALAAADKASDKLETATAVHFAAVNDLQQAMKDQAARFPTRDEIGSQAAALSGRVDELRLTVAGLVTKEAFDTFAGRQDVIRRDFADDLALYPSKAEIRAQMDTVTITVAAVQQKVADSATAQAIAADHYITREVFETFNKTQESNRLAARRAVLGAWVAGGIAAVGWVLTVVLYLISHKA